LGRKKERKVFEMRILQQLKTNARNNRRERPWSFAAGLVLMVCGTVGIVIYIAAALWSW
jgi:hypothetical protein